MTHEEAVRTAELIRTLEDKKDRLEDWIDSLKDQLKGYMTEQGASTLMLGTHKVSWTEYETTRFDTKAFKDDHKDLYSQYEVKSNVKRFTVR